MTIITAAARPAVREDAASAEAFDVWAEVPADLLGLDMEPLPACAFLPYEAHTSDMHVYWDLSGPWMECCGCGKMMRWEE